MAKTDSEWISANAAARILSVHNHAVARVAMSGKIAVQALPGMSPRYRRSDVEALAVASVRKPGAEVSAA